MSSDSNNSYIASSIQVLDSREAVRKRPGMYIGGNDSNGLHHLLWEISDNSIDEAINGHANLIHVILNEDGESVTVKDNGRGIPVDIDPKLNRSALEIIFNTLHAGAKFEAGSYKGSGGLHGVGASVTNFLSEFLTAKVYRDEKIYEVRFEKGNLTQGLTEVGSYSKYSRQGTGTEISFKPDPEIFPETKFDASLIAERLKIKTYVNPGLKILFEDLQSGTRYEFHHEGGIAEYLTELVKESKTKPIHIPCISLQGNSESSVANSKFEVVLQWTDDTKEDIRSFVNAIPTHDGGTHENGFREGLVRAIRTYMEVSPSVPKKLEIKTEDIREGLKAIVNLFYEGDLQFQSQNKVRLNNTDVQSFISGSVKNSLEQFLFNNSSTAEEILARIIAASRARQASRVASAKIRKGSSAKKLTLPGKLADCTSNIPSECEIFFAEGDSASGTGKQARDRHTQAILPLRGKVLNTEGMSLSAILKNKEISDIVEALGCGIGSSFDISKLRYHKIILLMDADSDGHHITTLFLTFLYRFLPDLIRAGHVYVAQPPLYKIMWGKERFWAKSDEEKDSLIKDLTKKDSRKKIEISRFKGLGEMMADTLKETALDPKTRSLIQVRLSDSLQDETSESISNLMGKDASKRYQMILENLDLIGDLDI